MLYGGTELVVDLLARGFQRSGHDVRLFTVGDSTCPVPKVWVRDEPDGSRIGHGVTELTHVIAGYDALADCDIVHDHSLFGPLYAGRPDVPVVTTVHGPFDDDLTAIYRKASATTGLIAISHAQRKPVPDLRILRVIHHGIDASDFPVGDGSGDDEGDYVLFLGRMAPDKGAHRAITVARKAGIRLLIAAKMRDQAEKDYFVTEVEPHLGHGVEYLGEVPHARKLELLAGARALLFPIRWNEPFGMVLVESLACGTPVLAFPEGAAPEVIEDGTTGFLCPDEAFMAEAVDRVGSLDRRACRAAVEGYFSADRMVAEHLALFETLVR